MKVELKRWSTLGLATALAGAGLAGCAGEAGEGGDTAQVGEAGQGEAGEGGEGAGGEGGEGGVDFDAAASDPVVYASALAVAEAHVRAARDAYRAGESEAAAEMFAHPVSEVLLEMDPVFAELGVADFKPMFSEASQAVIDGASVEDVDAKAEAIFSILSSAGEKAPGAAAPGAIAGKVIADQIERAVAMYARASEGEQYGPYLDGYGYFATAKATFERSSDAIRTNNAKLHDRIAKTLALLAKAYPGAKRPANLDANQGELSGASASVMLTAG